MMKIEERAMLVRLKICRFSGSKTDKKATKEVIEQNDAKSEAGHFSKQIVSKDALKNISLIEMEIRSEHAKRTLPWDQDGCRILSTVGFLGYSEKMRGYKDRWDLAVSDFLRDYDTHVEAAKKTLGKMFSSADYPDHGRLAGKFEFKWDVKPIPVARDFRVELANDQVEAIRAEITESTKSVIDNAITDVWQRLQEVVGKMAERLKTYDPGKPGNAGCFRDSLVGNISDLLELAPSLNITHDPQITAFCAEIKTKLVVAPSILRNDNQARLATMQAAEEISAKMSQFLS